MQNRRERKKEQTRLKIITCAVELMDTKGYGQTTMEEIAEKADVAKGTLYNYFPDKESIFLAYFQVLMQKQMQTFDAELSQAVGTQEKLEVLFDLILRVIEKNPILADNYVQIRFQGILNSDSNNSAQRSGSERFILGIIEEGQRNQEIRRDISALELTQSFQHLFRGFLFSAFSLPVTQIIRAEKARLIDLFLNGAKAEPVVTKITKE